MESLPALSPIGGPSSPGHRRVGHHLALASCSEQVHTLLEQVAKHLAGDGDLLFLTPSRSAKSSPDALLFFFTQFLYILPPLWKRVLKLNFCSQDGLFSSVVWLEGRFET